MTTASARSRELDRRYYGVAVAIVEEVDDPERQGRVRVSYPWLDDTSTSVWARVSQP